MYCTDTVNGFSPLYMSVIRADLPCVRVLIEHTRQQADIDMEDRAGRTPLIAALLSIVNNLRLVEHCWQCRSNETVNIIF